MENLEAQIGDELRRITALVGELTALTPRWSGKVELVPNADDFDWEIAVNTEHDEQREQLTNQVLSATMLPEVPAAQQALRAWIKAHPEEEGMRDGFEQLSLMQEIAEEQEQEAELARRIKASPQTSAK